MNFFQHQQHFPKKHFQFVEAGQRGRHHPSKVTMMLVLVIIMRIIHVDIGIVELIKFMKHLLVSLIHSGNLKFQLSFWANQALPKRKVRGIIQSSLSMHWWSKTSSHYLYYDYVISVWRKRASSPISVLEIGRAGSPMHHRWEDDGNDDRYHVIMAIVI